MSVKVVPINSVLLPEGKAYGWILRVDHKMAGFENPNFGRFEHVAFVDAEKGTFLYDGIRKLDGPIQENGHATPGAIMVVIEDRDDGIYLHCQEEYRQVIYDHRANQQGVTVLGFAGGFTKKGQSPSDTALTELLEEQGIEVEEASVELIGWASDNRASTETCIEVYLGRFKRKVSAKPDEHEVILKSVLVRIDQFKTGRDGIVDSAYAMVVEKLGLILPKQQSSLSARFAALAEEDPKAAEALLYMLERGSKK